MREVKNLRIKLIGKILSKTDIYKTNYSHGIYSMLLNILKPYNAERIHNQQSREYRLFTFSNIYIKESNFHLYISGTNDIVNEFIEGFEKDTIIRVEDMILIINKITLCPELPKKEKYLFKGKVIATELDCEKKKLITNDQVINKKLKKVALGKLKAMGIEGNIDFEILKKVKKVTRYKGQAHVSCYESLILASGDYEAIKAIYEVGVGENTATGHGLLWEV